MYNNECLYLSTLILIIIVLIIILYKANKLNKNTRDIPQWWDWSDDDGDK